jgi:outer membrane cobalamin receptor
VHVVVTATRLDDTPQTAAELPASVTVLDRAAIERSGARTIQDLLAEKRA